MGSPILILLYQYVWENPSEYKGFNILIRAQTRHQSGQIDAMGAEILQ